MDCYAPSLPGAPLDAYPFLKVGKLLPEGTALEDIPAKFQILVKV